MRLVKTAENFPARCFVTANIDGPFVDFETSAGDYGALYLHTSVVEEAAGLLGMIPEREVDAIVEKVQEMGDEIHALRERLRLMENLTEAETKLKAVA